MHSRHTDGRGRERERGGIMDHELVAGLLPKLFVSELMKREDHLFT